MRAYKVTMFNSEQGLVSNEIFYGKDKNDVLYRMKQRAREEGVVLLKVRSAYWVQKKLPLSLIIKFTDQLQVLLKSGLYIEEALQISARAFEGTQLGSLTAHVGDLIQKGSSFSDALKAQGVFPPYYLHVIALGEKTGDIATVFGELSHFLQMRKTMQSKFLTAMMYPLLILSILIVGIVLFTLFFLPKYETLVLSINSSVGQTVRNNIASLQWFAVFAVFALVATLCGTVVIKRNNTARYRVHKLVTQLPIIRNYVWSKELYWICFFLKSLLTAGVRIENAFAELRFVIGNAYMAEIFSEAADKLTKGDSLIDALAEHKALPALFSQWIALTDYADDKGIVFTRLHAFYKDKVTTIYNMFDQWAQPCMILAVGAILFLIIQAIIVPLFSMYTDF